MPQDLPKKRPNSAPVKKSQPEKSQRRPMRRSQRVLASKPETKIVISKYHERCMPSHWVPAPAKTTEKTAGNFAHSSSTQSLSGHGALKLTTA